MYADSFTVLAVAALMVPLGVLLLVVVVLATGRGEPDPTHQRGYAVYLGATTFVTLFVLLFTSYALVGTMADFVLTDEDPYGGFSQIGGGFGFSDPEMQFSSVGGSISGFDDDFEPFGFEAPSDDDARRNGTITDVVEILALGVPVALLYAFHRRRRDELVAMDGFDRSPPWRVDRAAIYSICFTAVLIVVFTSAATLSDVFRAIAPGVAAGPFDEGSAVRDRALVGIVSTGYLLAASAFVFRYHWGMLRDELPKPSPWPRGTTAPLADSDDDVASAAAGPDTGD